MRYIQKIIEWTRQTIGPWLSEMLESYPYAILILLGLIFTAVALIQYKKAKPKKHRKRRSKVGYTNFKGEVWKPDGQSWNSKKKRWESPDYKQPKE